MDRAALIVGAVAIATLVSVLVNRRRPAPPTAPTAHVPQQLDRHDFLRPDARWLITVFTSTTCSTCAEVWDAARPLESPQVAVQELEVERDARLHQRYEIDAVPTLLVSDDRGVVRRWFLGPVSTTALVSAVAELTDPDPSPPAEAAGDLDG